MMIGELITCLSNAKNKDLVVRKGFGEGHLYELGKLTSVNFSYKENVTVGEMLKHVQDVMKEPYHNGITEVGRLAFTETWIVAYEGDFQTVRQKIGELLMWYMIRNDGKTI
jgi:hypothetical protein